MQAGRTGVEEARKRFDPTLGYAFSTYAQWWIRAAINREVEHNSRTIRIPSHVWERQRGDLPPRALSLDEGIAGHDGLTIASRVRDESATPADEIERREIVERVRAAIACLPDRLRAVIEMRMQELSLDNVAMRLTHPTRCRSKWRKQLSRERVRQLERLALEQLKVALADLDGREA
jgi:RNA polymerase sigma factor (sigma-70 family)